MQSPSHGYELHQRLRIELGNIWHISQSQAYAILKRLEKQGDIAASRGRSAAAPRRQTLRITTAGRRRFKEWMEGTASARAHTMRLEYLTRLYFATRLMPDALPQIHIEQAREITRAIRRLRLVRRGIPEGQRYNRLSVDLRLRQLEVIRRWLRETRQTVISRRQR